MISFFAFSALLNFIVSIFLGILVYLKGKEKLENKIFALFAFSVAFWSFGYFFWANCNEESPALFWSRFLMAGAIFIPVFYFHFIVSFLNLAEKYKKIIYGGYGLSAFFLISNFTPYFVKSVEPVLFFPFWPKPGIFYHPFLLMFFSFVSYGWYLLLKSLRETKETTKKQQIKYFLLGTGIGFICGSTNYFLWYGIPIPPYLNILVSIYVILTTFAILKYHLFEIKVILTELLVGVMGILLLVFSFLLPEGYRIFAIGIFLLFCVFAYYLVKATHEESKRREEAEKLAIQEKVLKEEAERMAVQERTLREKAEKVAKEFERISNIKDQMLLSSQHYWRTPLTGMKGFLDMILTGDYGELSPALKEKLVIIQKLSQALHQRIEESIDITQFQIGKGMLNKEETQIEDFLNGVLEEFKPQLEERRLYLKTQFPKEKLPKIEIDQKRMRETYSNVIDNAIKHTIKGGITIVSKFMPHGLKLNQPSILCLVKDTGIGIPKEELSSIGTSPFERGEEAKKLSPMGKGIGLYLSRLIVEAHGGKLWIESEGKDKGTTIYIELPLSGEK